MIDLSIENASSNTVLVGMEDRRGWRHVLKRSTVTAGSESATIQALLTAGKDVILGPGDWALQSALTLSTERQALICQGGAVLKPAFDGNVVRMAKWFQTVCVHIDGADQPGVGTEGGGIVIGIDADGAGHANLRGSRVQDFYGNGFVWEQGSGANFALTYAGSCTGVGYLCTANYDDNNHGLFQFSHAVNCIGNGYSFLKFETVTQAVHNNDSRNHVLEGAKGFGCARNFYIETQGHYGSLFSELGLAADLLTASSRGSALTIIGTETAFGALSDLGADNRIDGFSSFNRYEFIRLLSRRLEIQNLLEGRYVINQTAARTFSTFVDHTDGDVIINHVLDGASSRLDRFYGLIEMVGLPTANPAVVGRLWNDAGTLKVSAG